MNGKELNALFNQNLEIIKEEATKGLFTLSKRASKAVQDNLKLQRQCQHEFDENGICKFCYKEEN